MDFDDGILSPASTPGGRSARAHDPANSFVGLSREEALTPPLSAVASSSVGGTAMTRARPALDSQHMGLTRRRTEFMSAKSADVPSEVSSRGARGAEAAGHLASAEDLMRDLHDTKATAQEEMDKMRDVLQRIELMEQLSSELQHSLGAGDGPPSAHQPRPHAAQAPASAPKSLHALAYGPLPLSTSPSADSGLPDLGATPRGAPRPVTDAGSSSRRRSDRAAGRPRVPARRAPFGSSTDGTGDGTGAGTGSSDRASVARELRAIREALKEQREMHRGMRDEMREERIRGVAQAMERQLAALQQQLAAVAATPHLQAAAAHLRFSQSPSPLPSLPPDPRMHATATTPRAAAALRPEGSLNADVVAVSFVDDLHEGPQGRTAPAPAHVQGPQQPQASRSPMRGGPRGRVIPARPSASPAQGPAPHQAAPATRLAPRHAAPAPMEVSQSSMDVLDEVVDRLVTGLVEGEGEGEADYEPVPDLSDIAAPVTPARPPYGPPTDPAPGHFGPRTPAAQRGTLRHAVAARMGASSTHGGGAEAHNVGNGTGRSAAAWGASSTPREGGVQGQRTPDMRAGMAAASVPRTPSPSRRLADPAAQHPRPSPRQSSPRPFAGSSPPRAWLAELAVRGAEGARELSQLRELVWTQRQRGQLQPRTMSHVAARVEDVAFVVEGVIRELGRVWGDVMPAAEVAEASAQAARAAAEAVREVREDVLPGLVEGLGDLGRRVGEVEGASQEARAAGDAAARAERGAREAAERAGEAERGAREGVERVGAGLRALEERAEREGRATGERLERVEREGREVRGRLAAVEGRAGKAVEAADEAREVAGRAEAAGERARVAAERAREEVGRAREEAGRAREAGEKAASVGKRACEEAGEAREWAREALGMRGDLEARIAASEEALVHRCCGLESQITDLGREVRDAREAARSDLMTHAAEARAEARRGREAAAADLARAAGAWREEWGESRRALAADMARAHAEAGDLLLAELERHREGTAAALAEASRRQQEAEGRATRLGESLEAAWGEMRVLGRQVLGMDGPLKEAGRAVALHAQALARLEEDAKAARVEAAAAAERSARAAEAAEAAVEATDRHAQQASIVSEVMEAFERALAESRAREVERDAAAVQLREDVDRKLRAARVPREEAMRAVGAVQEVVTAQSEMDARLHALERQMTTGQGRAEGSKPLGPGGVDPADHMEAMARKYMDMLISVRDRVNVLEKRLTEGATDVLGAGLRPAVASARAVAAVAERLGALEERLGTRAAEEQVREARREAEEARREAADLREEMRRQAAAARAEMADMWETLQAHMTRAAPTHAGPVQSAPRPPGSLDASAADAYDRLAESGQATARVGHGDTSGVPGVVEALGSRVARVEREMAAYAGVTDRLHQAIESLRATPTSDKVGGAASDLPQRLSGLAAEVDALREAQGRQAEALASLRGAVEAVGERARRGEEAAEGVAELRGRVGRIKETVRAVREASAMTESKCAALAQHVAAHAQALASHPAQEPTAPSHRDAGGGRAARERGARGAQSGVARVAGGGGGPGSARDFFQTGGKV